MRTSNHIEECYPSRMQASPNPNNQHHNNIQHSRQPYQTQQHSQNNQLPIFLLDSVNFMVIPPRKEEKETTKYTLDYI